MPARAGQWIADLDKGQPSPHVALFAMVLTFNDEPDAIGVDRLIAPDRREQVGRQRRAYLALMAADRKVTGWSATFETGTETPGDGVQEHGDRATVVDSYRVVWRPPLDQRPQGSGAVMYNGEPQQWRAEVRRDSGGWRVWSLTIPAWCGTYSRCSTAPATTPSAGPSSPPSGDPLGNVKEMLPCGLRDPYPQLHDCPSPTPS